MKQPRSIKHIKPRTEKHKELFKIYFVLGYCNRSGIVKFLKRHYPEDMVCSGCGKHHGEEYYVPNCDFIAAIVLQLHHMNEDPEDNRLSNLCWLCGDCHRAIHAWNRKHRKKKKKKHAKLTWELLRDAILSIDEGLPSNRRAVSNLTGINGHPDSRIHTGWLVENGYPIWKGKYKIDDRHGLCPRAKKLVRDTQKRFRKETGNPHVKINRMSRGS